MGIVLGFHRVSKNTLDRLKNITTIDELYDILGKHSEATDIDKTWEMIHFLLTGSKYPIDTLLSKIIYPKNSTLQFDDGEYDRAVKANDIEKVKEFQYKFDLSLSYLSPKEILQILEVLDNVSIDNQIKNYDKEAFAKESIYPALAPGELIMDESNQEYVKHHYNKLLKFMKETKEKQEYLLVNWY